MIYYTLLHYLLCTGESLFGCLFMRLKTTATIHTNFQDLFKHTCGGDCRRSLSFGSEERAGIREHWWGAIILRQSRPKTKWRPRRGASPVRPSLHPFVQLLNKWMEGNDYYSIIFLNRRINFHERGVRRKRMIWIYLLGRESKKSREIFWSNKSKLG